MYFQGASVANIGSCVSKRVSLARLPASLRAKLPLNVLLVDGRCNLAMGRMLHALERNYSFSAVDESKNTDLLLKNTLFFGSVNMPDSKELTRVVVNLLGETCTTSSTSGGGSRHKESGVKRHEEPDARTQKVPIGVIPPIICTGRDASSSTIEVPSFFMFIEQVPSKQALQRTKRHGGVEERMFMRSDGKSQDYITKGGMEDKDLLITTGGCAVVRVLTHLDRPHLKYLGNFLWSCCPRLALGLWTRRQESLKFYHGRQEIDMFKHPEQQRGLQERLWSSQGVGTGKVRKPVDVSKIFDSLQ